MKSKIDQRPDPKPRKNPHLWQAYLVWDEFVQLRKRHLLRLSSIEKGKSNLDAMFEKDFISTLNAPEKGVSLDVIVEMSKRNMIAYGQNVGPIWTWLTSLKGLGQGSLAAQLLAQVDDVGKFDTISKLWRFAGQAVIDGKAERGVIGEKSHYNRRLKSIVFLIADQFIKQRNPEYVVLYYEEKTRLRELYPEKIKVNGKWKYNDGHLHYMAIRKMMKIFLQHVWLIWRTCEGLPVSKPYVEAFMGHVNIIPPPNFRNGRIEIGE